MKKNPFAPKAPMKGVKPPKGAPGRGMGTPTTDNMAPGAVGFKNGGKVAKKEGSKKEEALDKKEMKFGAAAPTKLGKRC